MSHRWWTGGERPRLPGARPHPMLPHPHHTHTHTHMHTRTPLQPALVARLAVVCEPEAHPHRLVALVALHHPQRMVKLVPLLLLHAATARRRQQGGGGAAVEGAHGRRSTAAVHALASRGRSRSHSTRHGTSPPPQAGPRAAPPPALASGLSRDTSSMSFSCSELVAPAGSVSRTTSDSSSGRKPGGSHHRALRSTTWGGAGRGGTKVGWGQWPRQRRRLEAGGVWFASAARLAGHHTTTAAEWGVAACPRDTHTTCTLAHHHHHLYEPTCDVSTCPSSCPRSSCAAHSSSSSGPNTRTYSCGAAAGAHGATPRDMRQRCAEQMAGAGGAAWGPRPLLRPREAASLRRVRGGQAAPHLHAGKLLGDGGQLRDGPAAIRHPPLQLPVVPGQQDVCGQRAQRRQAASCMGRPSGGRRGPRWGRGDQGQTDTDGGVAALAGQGPVEAKTRLRWGHAASFPSSSSEPQQWRWRQQRRPGCLPWSCWA